MAEVEREARGAPGTAQLREAGCAQAKVYSPALLERFTGVFRGDGGVRDGDVPDFPVVVCVVHRGPTVDCEFRGDGGVRDGDVPDFPVVVCVVHREPTVDCETVARTYAEAVDPLPLRMGVTVRVGVDQAVRCEGLYGPDGTRLRSPDDDQGRIDDLAP